VLCTRNRSTKIAKCSYCGGSIIERDVSFGVFVWRGDGRYPECDAVRVFERESAADKFTHTDPRYVVREIRRERAA
jgi:hypothetical protein